MDGNEHRRSWPGARAIALWAIVAGFWLPISPTPSMAAVDSEGGFADVVAEHLQQYPGLEIEDVYKLAFQAAMGAEHAVPSRDAARAWLEREIGGLAEAPEELLIDSLSPDGDLVRINLRPFIALGGDATLLLDAFVRTATEFDGSQARLEKYWSTIEAMAAAGEVPFTVGQLQSFRVEMEGRGWPTVHHSATYESLYEPAYRVVLRRFLEVDGPMEETSGER